MDADHAMVVAYSRKAAYTMYKKFIELRPGLYRCCKNDYYTK